MTVDSRPQSLKERQRQERELLILRAASDLFTERGYHEMSLDDIAARVGIAKGTIYLHFARKEDLVIALLERGSNVFLEALNETLASSASPTEKLRAIITQFSGSLADQRHQVIGVLLQNPEIHSRMAQRREEMRECWDEPRRRLTEVIEQGKAEGDFDPTLPTPLVMYLLMGLLTPYGHRRLVAEGGMTSAEITEGLSRFFFKGIARDAAELPPRGEG